MFSNKSVPRKLKLLVNVEEHLPMMKINHLVAGNILKHGCFYYWSYKKDVKIKKNSDEAF